MGVLNKLLTWSPHWSVPLLLGLILGPYVRLLLSPIESLIVGWWRHEPLAGEWFEYHWSHVRGRPVFRKDRWKITKSTFDNLTVFIQDLEGKRTLYQGKMYKEGNHWIKETKGKDHPESTFSRLTSPIPPLDDMFVGICVSTDFDGKILGGVQLLCRRELTETEAREFLTKSAHVDAATGGIRVDSLWVNSLEGEVQDKKPTEAADIENTKRPL